MKRVNVLSSLSSVLVFTLPLLVAGCDSMFGNSDHSSNQQRYYDRNIPIDYNQNINNTSGVNQGASTGKKIKSSATSTTLVQPGISTVKTPKLTSSTTNNVPVDAPMVPGAAPAVGQ